MTYLSVTQGIDPRGNATLDRSDGMAAWANTPLAANASWGTVNFPDWVSSNGWVSTDGYTRILTDIFSDKPSATNGILLEYSIDGINVLTSATNSYIANVGSIQRASFPVTYPYIRYKYTNGSQAQTVFALEISLLTSLVGSSDQSIGSTLNNLALAQTTKAVIELPDSGGVFDKVQRTVNSLNVNVTGGSITSTGSATSANQATEIASLASIDGKLPSLGQRVAAGSISVVLASDQGAIPIKPQGSTTVNTSRVSSTAATTALLASNANRKGFSISPESTIFVKFGSGATATNYDVKMNGGMLYESRTDVLYTGLITCYGLASVQISEYA